MIHFDEETPRIGVSLGQEEMFVEEFFHLEESSLVIEFPIPIPIFLLSYHSLGIWHKDPKPDPPYRCEVRGAIVPRYHRQLFDPIEIHLGPANLWRFLEGWVGKVETTGMMAGQ